MSVRADADREADLAVELHRAAVRGERDPAVTGAALPPVPAGQELVDLLAAGEHWPSCFIWHPECGRRGRDAVACAVPWTALGYATAEQCLYHLVVCADPVHRYDVAWQLKALADHADHRARHLREVLSRDRRIGDWLMSELHALLRDTHGRRTVPRDRVAALRDTVVQDPGRWDAADADDRDAREEAGP